MRTSSPVVWDGRPPAPGRKGARNGSVWAGGREDGPTGGGGGHWVACRRVRAGRQAWPARGAEQSAGRIEHVRGAGGRPRTRGGAARRIAAGDVHGRGWLRQD